MKKIDRKHAKHYNQKNVCDGWHFVNCEELSVIVERMSPHTSEDMHYHRKARQFFYILSSEAQMKSKSETIILKAGTGIEIEPLEAHQMINISEDDLEFIVVSMPKAHGDKIKL